jgi:hypothetical protein
MKRIPSPLGAALLGASSLVITPFVALGVYLPILLVQAASESALDSLGQVFHLQDMGRLFLLILVVVFLVWLAGIVGAVFISWVLYRSKRLAALTLASAMAIQLVGAIVWNAIEAQVHKNDKSDLAAEGAAFAALRKQIDGYADLGPPVARVTGRHDDWEDDRRAFGPYYESLTVSVPIRVRRAGTYRLRVHYEYMRECAYRYLGDQEETRALACGQETVQVSFPRGLYRSSEYTGSLTSVRAYYVLSRREFLELAKPNLHMSPRGLRNLEKELGRLDARAHGHNWEEYVDSSGTFTPRPAVLPPLPPELVRRYEHQGHGYSRNDRGQLTRRIRPRALGR